ncbi:hypothetical protein D0861_00294 [Hortaea werneckii]|uniref:Uncharacterized protein n=1 Tax=Hortaea werneckii TaxID=91943 RepID=A0A3M7G530_HORWE|nr:hypothetical protein D0861_00294 [Hortaea werneckii]
MASSSFRDSMNSLGWSRREQPANTNKQNPLLGSLQRYNPFGGEGNVQLPTTEGEAPGAPLPARSRREEEEGWFAHPGTVAVFPVQLYYTCECNCDSATATWEHVGPILALG